MMDFFETIKFILTACAESGYGHELISVMLEHRGIAIPWHVVRDIVARLHPYPLDSDPVLDVEWCMRGFQFILENFAAGETSMDITCGLQDNCYDWDPDFVSGIMITAFFWQEHGNQQS